MLERVDAARHRFGVVNHQQFHARRVRCPVAHRVHGTELPRRVHVQQRKGRRRRMEGLARQVQQHRTVLPGGIQQHRSFRLGDDLAEDLDALGFEAPKVAGRLGRDICNGGHAATPWNG